MELHKLLLNYIPSKEIKNRQIKVNNEVVQSTKINLLIEHEGIHLGDFILKNNSRIPKCFYILDIKDFFGEEYSNIFQINFLREYTLISFSKKDHFVFKNLTF